MQPTGNVWRYCDNLESPEAIQQLVQAVLTAYTTIEHARRNVNPEDFATAPDWAGVQAELHRALAAVGHPAGQ